MAIEHEIPVLIVGGGPAGLILAFQLARRGTKCMLVEQRVETSIWPKMDLTNCRSMELLRRLDLGEALREVGVPGHFPCNVLFSNGFSDGGKLITKWELPSVDEWREKIKQQNDGSMPAEPYQRCSQFILESMLKLRIQAEPLVESHFGMTLESLLETPNGVECRLTDQATGEKHVVRCEYLVGTDGANSRVRRDIGGELTGGPVPAQVYAVHFKSRDLSRIHRQGQFWRVFFLHGASFTAQDEVDTWTIHSPVSLDTDVSSWSPEEHVYKTLGGSLGPFPIKIDQVLMKSLWRPNMSLVDRYRSVGGRVFLAGDAAHQVTPTGGYGMNSAVADSFDIGWKLSAVLAGWGGKYLLDSYELERRPVAMKNMEHSGVHWSVHAAYWQWMKEDEGRGFVAAHTKEGDDFRKRIADLLTERDGENKDQGMEFGYRYTSSPIVVPDEEAPEPAWERRSYVPSTWPGVRAPHVYLADGETSIFDLFGQYYSLVDFTANGAFSGPFKEAAARLHVPLKVIHLPNEAHVRKVWERDAVLVRPDDHVAWRAALDGKVDIDAEQILLVATGKKSALSITTNGTELPATTAAATEQKGLTQTVSKVDEAAA